MILPRFMPRFPIYVVSKGRWETRLTSRALEADGVPYFVVVEEQELEKYAEVIDRKKLLVLDKKYQRDYDTFDLLGDAKSKGPGAARNFAWDHAIRSGAAWHWVMDDNIDGFYRLHLNQKIPCDCAALRCMEDFVLRYENVAMAGPNYYMFAPRKAKIRNPFILNTRIYSCNLIRNDLPYRWRGRYNEDTDLSLRMLKDGWCTVQFNAFLQMKKPTQKIAGGNTAEFYSKEGTMMKSQMLVAMHPDVSELVWKFSRAHHVVDYSRFRANKLIRRKRLMVKDDGYGFKLTNLPEGRKAPRYRQKSSAASDRATLPLQHALVQGGDVPGGHHVIFVGERKPYIPSMRECSSVPLRHSDVVVDVGAYVGTFAIRAARFPVRAAVAYEPTPKSFEVMSLSKGVNLTLRQAAVVGDDRKEVEFFVGQGYGPTNSLFESRNRKRTAIKVPAANYVEAVRGATVVKLDIEGGEYDLPVLQPGVRAYIIDFHRTRPDWLERAKDIIASLEGAGFKAIIEPKWSSGLDRAGSWIRELPEGGPVCEPLMKGEACCGCGVALQPTGSRSLCPECAKTWLPRHRRGFTLGQPSARTAALSPRSEDRSTTATPRKGAARRRSAPPNGRRSERQAASA